MTAGRALLSIPHKCSSRRLATQPGSLPLAPALLRDQQSRAAPLPDEARRFRKLVYRFYLRGILCVCSVPIQGFLPLCAATGQPNTLRRLEASHKGGGESAHTRAAVSSEYGNRAKQFVARLQLRECPKETVHVKAPACSGWTEPRPPSSTPRYPGVTHAGESLRKRSSTPFFEIADL